MSVESVVILCGGRGTRLQEHTRSLPKPLVEIGGRPILWHVMRIYAAQGLRRFVLCTGYLGEQIERFVAEAEWPETVDVECVDTGVETPTGGRIAPFSEPRSITGLYTVDALLTGNWAALSSALRYLALPAFTLGVAIGGIFIRLVRVNMIQTLKADYVEAARARGVPERQVVLRHAFRNALVPVVTIVGLQFALLLSGAVLTETTFTWPGIGLSLYQFLQDRDYIGVQGLVTFYALFVVAVSLLIDVVSAWVDPRIRYGR